MAPSVAWDGTRASRRLALLSGCRVRLSAACLLRGAAQLSLSGGAAGDHLMPGIGVGFIPDVLNRSILDEVIAVTDEQAFDCTRRLAQQEGVMAGISSGAALHAAISVASRADAPGRRSSCSLPTRPSTT